MDFFTQIEHEPEVEDVTTPSNRWRIVRWVLSGTLFVLIGLGVVVAGVVQPPADYPEKHIYALESGSTLGGVSEDLAELRVVRSSQLLQLAVLLGGNKPVIAGDYLFEEPNTLFEVARRITNGDFGDSRTRVVLQEGMTIVQMAEVLDGLFENFDTVEFLELAEGREGYLFPSTYFFFPSMNTEEIFDALTDTFQQKITPLLPQIEQSEHTLEEIITMASIIEKEAGSNNEERKIISGILWKRIAIGMPLQVDAPFVYIIGKGSAQLTRSDLAMDSPYNTYINKGLPPGPIGNPGLASIEAALAPTDSPYLFYLHGSDGLVRYGRTHTEHVINKNSYLR